MSCTSGLTSKSHVPELRVAGLRCLFIGWLMLAGGCLHEAAAQTGGAIDRGRLSQAVALDDVRTVRAQVEARAIGVNDPISGIGYDATPMLTVTARHASLNVLRYLIAAKADLNVRTPDNDTAAMLAAFFGEEERERMTTSTERHDQALRILIEAGAPLENIADAYTPLAYVAYAGRENAVRYLLEKGARADRHLMVLPAYDQCIKASHRFNLLDARGVISVTERQSYILRVRELAKACGAAWLKTEAGGAG